MELGDTIERALTTVGITKGRVESWLGGPCGCAERKEKLNALGRWASRVVRGKVDRALEFFDAITQERNGPAQETVSGTPPAPPPPPLGG